MSSPTHDPQSNNPNGPSATPSTPRRLWESLAARVNYTLWGRLFPFLRWFPIGGDVIRADLIAGIAGALVLVPKAMAYAQLSGLPVHYGLYAAFIPAIIGALWGSSRLLLTGPVAVISLMTASALAPLAVTGSDEYIVLAFLLALLVGVIQFGMGVFKLGLVVNFVSNPVIVGFINAAAIIIALSQLNKLLGLPLGRSDSFLYDVWEMFTQIGRTHVPTLLMGLLGFGIIYGMKKFTPPGIGRTSVLVAVAVTTLVSALFHFEHKATAKVDQIAEPHTRNLVSNFVRIEERIADLNRRITEKNIQLRELQKQTKEQTRAIIALRNDISLLQLELTNAEKNKLNRLREVRKLDFVLVPGQNGGRDTLYSADHVPAGIVVDDERRWHIKKFEGGEMKLIGGGEVVGQIPEGLPSFNLPKLNWDALVQLLTAAFIIAMVAFMESISMAKAIAAQTRTKVDPNQELIGQGLANVSGSLFQSYPVTGSFSGSAINLDAGAKTGFASVFNGLFVAVTLLLLTPYLYHLPQAVLSVIIIMAVAGLIHLDAIKRAWQANRNDGIVAIVSFVMTLAFAPHLDKGVMAGAGLALVLFLYRSMQPRVALLARHADGTLRDAEFFGLKTCENITMLRFDGSLYFANTSYFEDKVMERVSAKPDLKYVIVVGDGINEIDASGEEMLRSLAERLQAQNIRLLFAGLKQQVYNVMVNTGLHEILGPESFFRTSDRALDYAWKQIGHNHEVDCPLNVVCPVKPTSPS
jgi:SulP family sulfate permease